MNFRENAQPLTAMKTTKEFMQYCADATPDAEMIPDNDPIYEGYVVILANGEFTIAPNAEEFFSVFTFVNEEIPGKFAPIKYKEN